MRLEPVYAYNAPRQPIRLHEGLAGGLADEDIPTTVELMTTGSLALRWGAELPGRWQPDVDRSPVLLLRRATGDAALPVRRRDYATGWTNGGEIGDASRTVHRVVAHWFNLPDIDAPWTADLGEWRIVIEPRPDLDDVLAESHLDTVLVITHVVQITHVDGIEFRVQAVSHVLEALHLGLSFALGRWTAPMLPVGLDNRDEVVFESWHVLHCDPAVTIQSGWWQEHEHADLTELLAKLVAEFADPDRRAALVLQLHMAVIGTTAQGFVEQRIMIGGGGVEHLMWQMLVLAGHVTKEQYKAPRAKAHNHLRRVLAHAKIPTGIDSATLPTLAQYAADEQVRQGRTAAPFDGPEILMQIRNRIVHPEDKQEQIYKHHDLVTEAWCLMRHYLCLLILWSIDYRGRYRDLRVLSGNVFDGIGPVPWA